MLESIFFRRQPAHYQTLEYVRVQRLLEQWRAASPATLSVLDYGFGTGRYLSLFASLGFAVAGVDINQQYIDRARGQGFDVHHESSLDDLERKFDIIFLGPLIEHLSPHELIELLPRLAQKLAVGGRLIMISPVLGERFFHDFSHIRPYYPQSIRHAFGQTISPLSYGPAELLRMVDIYFFKDPYRTRGWRSFYLPGSRLHRATKMLNWLFDQAWWLSAGRVGATSSWLGVYVRSEQVVGK